MQPKIQKLARTTQTQWEFLKNSMSYKPARGLSIRAQKIRDRQWAEMTLKLNDLGPPIRSTSRWKRVWSDYIRRSNMKSKSQIIKNRRPGLSKRANKSQKAPNSSKKQSAKRKRVGLKNDKDKKTTMKRGAVKKQKQKKKPQNGNKSPNETPKAKQSPQKPKSVRESVHSLKEMLIGFCDLQMYYFKTQNMAMVDQTEILRQLAGFKQMNSPVEREPIDS